MNYQDIRLARETAQREIDAADRAVSQAAQLIVGRLRSSGTNGWILEELKRELKDYNIKTYSWIDRG